MNQTTCLASHHSEEVYLAGGCLWGVQAFVRRLPGVIVTEAGRVNGKSNSLDGAYDGYVECVRTEFNPMLTSVVQLLAHLFEIIDPYSFQKQGPDMGPKYRTGFYSQNPLHLQQARRYIQQRVDHQRIFFEVLPLAHYLKSADCHQDRLQRRPQDLCHIQPALLHKYRNHDALPLGSLPR
jgi:peptide-methionine (S)-S-oxide reductase